ncbi:MAG: endonuclease/exonuclease/phosphatase family protein [Bradymonadia bacterium]
MRYVTQPYIGIGLMVLFMGCDANDAQRADPIALTLMSYNVHGLPSVITMDDTSARMKAISPRLSPYAVIAIQEDFDEMHRQELLTDVDHAEQRTFSEALDGRVYGSGLTFLSRFNVVAAFEIHYSTCFGRFDSASDCLASKGLQAIRIQIDDGVELDIYNTHLEAGNGTDDAEARGVQVSELLQALTAFSGDRALMVLGDTNLHEDKPVDAAELRRLYDEGGLKDTCIELDCPEPNRIDRILYRSSDDLVIEPQGWRVSDEFNDESGIPLSDHDPIIGDFALTPTRRD